MANKKVTLIKLHELAPDALIEVTHHGKHRVLGVKEVMELVVGRARGTHKRGKAQRVLARAAAHFRRLQDAIEAGNADEILKQREMCDRLTSPEWTSEKLSKAGIDMHGASADEIEDALITEADITAARKPSRKVG
jgi:hypothetical protein